MAPNFFSKLVKSPDRHSGDHSRNPSPASHSRHQSTASDSSFYSPLPPDDQEDAHPNVTVVPPSPSLHDESFPFPSEQAQRENSHNRYRTESEVGLARRAEGAPDRRTVSMSVAMGNTSEPDLSYDDPLPTPTPASMKAASSNGNIKSGAEQNGNGWQQSNTNSLQDDSPDSSISRSPSNPSSVRSQNRHPRAATDSVLGLDLHGAERNRRGSDGSTFSEGDGSGYASMTTIVESPTSLRSEFKPMIAANGLAANGAPAGNHNVNYLTPHRKADTDGASIRSTSTSGKKRRPWRRRSNPSSPTGTIPSLPSTVSVASINTKNGKQQKDRKPTGLASALAASGLAMANPGTTMPMPMLQQQSSSGSLTTSPKQIRSGRLRGHSDSSNKKGGKSRSRVSSVTSDRGAGLDSVGASFSDDDSASDRGSLLSDEDDDDDDLDLNDDDIPVTGFAVASNKRNADFHELFPTIPEGDYLIDDYGCALQREILIQGRIYISENHVCFHANIFGWITDLTIPMYEITSLEKRMTAFVIPNAIQLNTRTAKYTFASFLSRDTTYDVIYNIWRLARPEDASIHSGAPSGRPSLEGASQIGDIISTEVGDVVKVGMAPKKMTQCACLKNGDHFPDLAMDTVLPGTPEKIYNLMFASGFIKEFMIVDQKLQDIQISDWHPSPENPKCLSRNMSYIKPLGGGLGPKQTKCEIRDETIHCDFDDYIVMLTTTRSPDVPSGGVFSVKTKTCLMWASSLGTRIIVTSQVEWTGRSFIKGLIEKSCLEGQKTYHADLDKAIRQYISEHQSEFVPEGVDPAAVVAEQEIQLVESPLSTVAGPSPLSLDGVARKGHKPPANQPGLQWAWDTFAGAYDVGQRSASGAIELLMDAWENSSTTTILYFMIVILVISNVWSFNMVGKREEIGRRKEMRRTEEREKWVQGVVTALWEELAASRNGNGNGNSVPAIPTWHAGDWRGELADIHKALDTVEERVHSLRQSLQELE